MRPGLNPEHPSPAYHAGRLMAVLAALHNKAGADSRMGAAQRYYSAASTSPALVLGHLIKEAQYHLKKLRNEKKEDLATWYEDLLGRIMAYSGGSFPVTLTLEEQSLFALGYYQQRGSMLAGAGEKSVRR